MTPDKRAAVGLSLDPNIRISLPMAAQADQRFARYRRRVVRRSDLSEPDRAPAREVSFPALPDLAACTFGGRHL